MKRIIQNSPCSRPRGRNLTELNVVISILSLLGLFASYQWSEMASKYKLEGFTDVMVADLKFARSQAVALNQIVTVVFNDTGYAICSPNCLNPTQTFKVVRAPTYVRIQANLSTSSFYPYAQVTNTSLQMATINSITASIAKYAPKLKTLIDQSGRIQICTAEVTTDISSCGA